MLKFSQRKGHGDGYWWRCGTCTTWKSCRTLSFFELFSTNIIVIFNLIYDWCIQKTCADITQVTGVSQQTLTTLYQHLRLIVVKELDRNNIKVL